MLVAGHPNLSGMNLDLLHYKILDRLDPATDAAGIAMTTEVERLGITVTATSQSEVSRAFCLTFSSVRFSGQNQHSGLGGRFRPYTQANGYFLPIKECLSPHLTPARNEMKLVSRCRVLPVMRAKARRDQGKSDLELGRNPIRLQMADAKRHQEGAL
ncbi:MAG: hypothetical protein WCA49_00600 [Candidatus Sulfotelmatobacter sp.]